MGGLDISWFEFIVEIIFQQVFLRNQLFVFFFLKKISFLGKKITKIPKNHCALIL